MEVKNEYHCKICGRTFKKFVIFEGHFTFNLQCRTKCGPFMQCYICEDTFHHLAVLKYHLQSHRKTNVFQQTTSPNNVQITENPKENSNEERKAVGFNCSFCERSFRSKFHLVEHLAMHSKTVETNNDQMNGNGKVEKLNKTNRDKEPHLTIHSKTYDAISNKTKESPEENVQLKRKRCSDTNELSESSEQTVLLKRTRRDYRCQICNANCYHKGQLGNNHIIYFSNRI